MKAARYLLALVVSSLVACSGQFGPGGGVGPPEPPPVPVVPAMQTPPPVSTLRSPPPARAERPDAPPREPVIAAAPGLPPEPMPLPRSLSSDQQRLARLAAERATMEPRMPAR